MIKMFFLNVRMMLLDLWCFSYGVWSGIKSGIKAFWHWGWELDKKIARKIWSGLKVIWLWIIGHPAELTYWFEGIQNIVRIRKFKEIKPNHIMFKNVETNKHVILKSSKAIKYIIREE